MYQHTLKVAGVLIWLVAVGLLAVLGLLVVGYLAPYLKGESLGYLGALFGILVLGFLWLMVAIRLFKYLARRFSSANCVPSAGDEALADFQATRAVTRGFGRAVVRIGLVMAAALVIPFLIYEPGVRLQATTVYNYLFRGATTKHFVAFGCFGAVALVGAACILAAIQAISEKASGKVPPKTGS